MHIRLALWKHAFQGSEQKRVEADVIRANEC